MPKAGRYNVSFLNFLMYFWKNFHRFILAQMFLLDSPYAIYTPFGTEFSPVYKYRIVGGQKTLALEDKYNKQNLNKY